MKVALENVISSSTSSGSEKINVILEFSFLDSSKDTIQFNDKPLIRNSLDYHETIRFAREVEKLIK